MTVRLAGTSFAALLGMELTGQDWIALAPEYRRAGRLRIFADIAAGALCVATRHVETGATEVSLTEELLLPLAADPVYGAYPVLCHVDWKSARPDMKIKSPTQAIGTPDSFNITPLPGLVAA